MLTTYLCQMSFMKMLISCLLKSIVSIKYFESDFLEKKSISVSRHYAIFFTTFLHSLRIVVKDGALSFTCILPVFTFCCYRVVVLCL